MIDLKEYLFEPENLDCFDILTPENVYESNKTLIETLATE